MGKGMKKFSMIAMLAGVLFVVSAVQSFAAGTATVSLFREAPKVDGRIAPGEWDGAVRIMGFLGLGKGPLRDKMSASWVGYTEERLYIAVAGELPPDGKLAAMEKASQVSRRDTLYGAGGIELWIDANRWRRQDTKSSLPFVQFIGNATGAIFDKKYGIPSSPPDLAWNGDWEFENGIYDTTDEDSPIQSETGIWVTEVSISFEELGMDDNPVGKTIGVMVGRNWKRNRGGQMSWFLHRGAYSQWASYPRIKLSGNDPSVQIMSLGEELFKSHLELSMRIFNPADEPREVRVEAAATSSDMPGKRDKTNLKLAPNAHTTYEFEVDTFHEQAKHKLHLVVKDPASDAEYLNYTMPWQRPKREKWDRSKIGPQPQKAVRLRYYPSYGFFRIRVDTRELGEEGENIQSGEVTLLGPDGSTVLTEALNWDSLPAKHRIEVGTKIDPGKYTARIQLEGYGEAFERTFTRRYFEWEGNRLGITNEVYEPFEPVRQEGDRVSVVMREYNQKGLGLWTSVRAHGNKAGSPMRELLATPIRVKVNDGAVLGGEGEFTEHNNQRVVYAGKAMHPAVSVETRCVTFYDGAMKVNMTLDTGEKAEKLQRLWIDIPIREDMAPLFHATTTGLRNNPAGTVPAGEGQVWNSKKLASSGWYGNFKPYLWVGAEERGICWFADNDKNWELNVSARNPEESAPCQELIRRDGQVVIRVNIIQKPVTITEPREIVFGLMASPGKPMPRNWRNIFFRDRPKNARTIHWMAAQYWGSPSVMYSKLPIDQDTSVLSKLQEVRLGGGGQGQFLKAWANEHLQGDISDKTYKSKKQIIGLLKHALRISSSAQDYLTAYWEEFHVTHAYHPESAVFGGEWGRHNYPDSYIDFAVWCGAEFLRRGIGLYFDNSFPKRGTDPVTTEAYELPNGFIQPSANMWRHREYLRRIWVLHQQLPPESTKPIMMLHMTNTHVIPYMVFNQSNLDLEWLYGAGSAQSKYPADLLRAESIGLQSGNIPTSLAKGSHRTRFGALMVHEIRAENFKASGQTLLSELADFGYTHPEATIFNYWDADPPMTPSDPKCKWLLVKHHGELMVLFCTWNPDNNEVRVSIDTDALGLQPEEAKNVEQEDELRDIQNGKFSFTMPGHGVRVFHIK